MPVSKLTVMFDEPFWTAVFERTDDGKLEACRVVFGAEPKDAEVYDFFLKNYNCLRFSPAVRIEEKAEAHKINPKRLRRIISRGQASGVETKAQQALSLMRQENKLERKHRTHQEKEAEDKRRFELRQQKRKQKHRGK